MELQNNLCFGMGYSLGEFNMEYFFEIRIGLWNAWIGMVILWLSGAFMMLLDPKATKRMIDTSWNNKQQKFWSALSMIFMYGVIIFSVFIPLKINTGWFYTGLIVWLTGIAAQYIAMLNYASTPLNQTVTTGVYKYSRNPMYFFYSLSTLGVCVASASLPMLIAWGIYNIPTHMVILGEEWYCRKIYGASYESLMNNVPRYFMFF